MTTRNQNAGIAAALLGLAGGLFAWWRYNNATPEEKERLKNKVNELKTAEKKYEEIVEEYKILETKGKESVRALIKEHESQTALNAEKFKRGCETLEKNFQKHCQYFYFLLIKRS